MISIPKIASSIVPFFLYVSSGWLELDMGAHWLVSRGGRKDHPFADGWFCDLIPGPLTSRDQLSGKHQSRYWYLYHILRSAAIWGGCDVNTHST